MTKNNRKFYRKVIDIPARLHWNDYKHPVVIVNISLSGVYIWTTSSITKNIKVGEEVIIEYELLNKDQTFLSETMIVVRVDKTHTALTLKSIPAMQSKKGFFIDSQNISSTDLYKSLKME